MSKRLLALEFLLLLFALSACQAAGTVVGGTSLVSANVQSLSKSIPNTGRVNLVSEMDMRAVSSEAQQRFDSARYLYAMAYPKGWQLSQQPGFVDEDQAVYAGNPGTDTYRSADGLQSLVVGLRALPAGVTLENYVQAGLRQASQQYITCGDPESSQPLTIGGSAGEQFSYHCSDGYYLLLVFAVRGAQGLTAAWQSPAGSEMLDLTRFHRMIGSLMFK